MVFFFFFSFPPKHSRCKRNYKNMHVSHLCEREQRWFVFVFIKIVNCWIVVSFNSNAIYFSKYNLIASRIFRSFNFFFPSWYHYVTYFSHLLYLPSYYLDPWKNQPKKKKIIFHACSLCISLLSPFFSISYFSHLLYLPSDHRKPWKDKPKKKKRKRKNHLSSLFSLSISIPLLSSFVAIRERGKQTWNFFAIF